MRKILGTLALMVLSLMSLGLANAQTCPPGMVSYWKFDEGSGTTAGDSVNGNHGTIYGAAWVDGKVGSALSFDGIDDYVYAGNNSSLDLHGEVTVETWFKYDSRINTQTIVFADWSEPWYYPDPKTLYKLAVNWAGIGRLSFEYSKTTQESYWRYSGELLTDTWYHAVAVKKVDNTVDLYINGELDNAGEGGSIGSVNPETLKRLTIGKSGWRNFEFFDGTIDEVAIYNRALSALEIQQHYENGLKGLGYCELPTISVEIDIKPGSYPNSINLKSEGVIPVAILTTETFDATSVEGTTVIFGPDGAKSIHDEEHLEDVNNDDKLDWVGHFKTQETGIKDTDKEATITGKTKNGKDFTGKDSVNIVGGPKKAPALNPKHKLAMTWASIKSK